MLRATLFLVMGLYVLSATGCQAPSSGRGAHGGDQEESRTPPPPPVPRLSVRRFAENPIIRPDMLPGDDGRNINGPSLIRVPDWIPNPLGAYYLYFADHGGQYIRMAYADALTGPWTVYKPGTLWLDQAPDARKHVASPDVAVDEESREIRMYFHCPSKTRKSQLTYLARSTDGIHFAADSTPLAPYYLRVFRYRGWWYGMTKPGRFYRSPDGITPFEEGPNPFLDIEGTNDPEAGIRMRHVALDFRNDTLDVYFTNVGNMPESILRSTVKLEGDWTEWNATAPGLVLEPETACEGADLPLRASEGAKSTARERAVRDPAIFKEDGRTYLLYSVAGESGIGIAEIVEHNQ